MSDNHRILLRPSVFNHMVRKGYIKSQYLIDGDINSNIQQIETENAKLKEQLGSAREVIGFYGDESSWEQYHAQAYSRCCIKNKDWQDEYLGNDGHDDKYSKPIGGKRAREWLENNK